MGDVGLPDHRRGAGRIVYGIAFGFGGSFVGSVPLGILIIGLSVTSYVGLGFFFGSRFARLKPVGLEEIYEEVVGRAEGVVAPRD
ncbi:MAG: hypothetical protein HKO98_12145 [Gemmatimonadetes bacterium]|nr:hypothetical protein [Gemmatimonadota bacterium]